MCMYIKCVFVYPTQYPWRRYYHADNPLHFCVNKEHRKYYGISHVRASS